MIRQNPKGLGDSIENFTTRTGIKSMVDTVSKGLNIPCGEKSVQLVKLQQKENLKFGLVLMLLVGV